MANMFKNLSKDERQKRKVIRENKKALTNPELKPLENKIVFISFHGKGYSDSPRAIYEVMREDPRFKDFEFYWVINFPFKKKIRVRGAKIVGYNSIEWYELLGTSKIIISNCRLENTFYKREDQLYFETWHGTPLKRLGCDIQIKGHKFNEGKLTYDEMVNTYIEDSKKYDAFITPSPFCENVLSSAFKLNKETLQKIGYPRNDTLFKDHTEDNLKLRKQLNIPANKKIILYAPTYRDLSYDKTGYEFTLQVDFEKWEQVLGNDYVVLFKPHYLLVYDNLKNLEKREFFKYIPAYKDIAEYYSLADILITDYSSVMFDYANLNKPIYLYIYDWEHYKNETRDFYFDIKEKLGKFAFEDEDLLLNTILSNKYDYKALKEFNNEFNPYEDGNNSVRALEIIAEMSKKKGII